MGQQAEPTDDLDALNNLDNLDSVEPDDSNPDDAWLDQAEADRQADEADRKAREAAQQGAAWAVGAMEGLVTWKYPYIQFDKSTRKDVSEKLEAVLYKHGGGIPPWLEPYREEIELGVVLGVAGIGVWWAVHEVEKAEAEAERKNRENGEGAGHAHETE